MVNLRYLYNNLEIIIKQCNCGGVTMKDNVNLDLHRWHLGGKEEVPEGINGLIIL